MNACKRGCCLLHPLRYLPRHGRYAALLSKYPECCRVMTVYPAYQGA